MSSDETVWHRVSYNLETPDDKWEPYVFSTGPSADGTVLIARASDYSESERDYTAVRS